MSEGGKTAKAGQAVRLLDIPCQRAFGAWDDLHGFSTGTQMSDHLKQQATKHHGLIGRAFLERLTRDETVFTDRLEAFKGLEAFTIDDGGGQAKRAATRFALMAMAGELATSYGLTGWAAGEATEAAAIGLTIWLESRGNSDNQETKAVLDSIQDFIDRHGDSRFSILNGSPDAPIVRDRAGWRDGGTYLFTGEGIREATKQFDLKAALNALAASGWLKPSGSHGKTAKVIRVEGQIKRLYVIEPRSDLD
jgi:putative DNA primase/helicase